MQTPTGSRWKPNTYITRCHRQLGLVGVRVAVGVSQLEFELQFEAVITSSRHKACGPQWPPVEQPSRMRKKCCYSQRNFGSICCSLFTSHTQLFRNPFTNKVWEVYFSKEVCSFVIIVDYVSACIRIRIVVSRLYNNAIKRDLVSILEFLFLSHGHVFCVQCRQFVAWITHKVVLIHIHAFYFVFTGGSK